MLTVKNIEHKTPPMSCRKECNFQIFWKNKNNTVISKYNFPASCKFVVTLPLILSMILLVFTQINVKIISTEWLVSVVCNKFSNPFYKLACNQDVLG